ncbi:PHO85 cyclin-5 [Coemansia interrupta]|uniref:PHO85 cyclin-5 n=1 Tax=Coemansia interrupta TaxID=1126814 RepID=A0A9W8LLG9_9FUNG|nr:PHO85 cyclin-5 [Coemansia interrupta]
MVSYSTRRTIESSTRLHHQDAVALGGSRSLAATARSSSNLALHVDGWYQQQNQNTTAALAAQQQPRSAGIIPSFDRTCDYSADRYHIEQRQQQQQQQRYYAHEHSSSSSAIDESGDCSGSLKRSRDTAGDISSSDVAAVKRAAATRDESSQAHHGGVRITDLLNPAAAAAAAGPVLSAAHRMTLPSSLARAQSDDAKHFYQQIANIQTQMQQQQTGSGSSTSVDPTTQFARTATAPTERATGSSLSESSSRAQGLVREALELDKLYDIACVIIESIWPNHSTSQRTQLCSLRCFVAETHRQSRLCVDVLELCMFYLLRAKSIIQAKQRAARQKEEQEEQEQQLKAKRLQQQQQEQQQVALLVGDANNTPPLSPCNNVPSGQYTVDGQLASGVVLLGGGNVTPGFELKASISPITPESEQSLSQVAFIAGDKQQILRNGMVTPLFPLTAKQQGNSATRQIPVQQRRLAGSTASLPNSYRSFVSTALKQADDAAAVAAISKPAEKSGDGSNAGTTAPAAKPKPDVTKCGRRMFVAALISASKFIHDQTYSNRAWHKITKLPMAQISDMERAFLDMIDYRLYVDRTTYDKFHRLLARSGMRNGRLMVCDPSASVSMSPSAGVMTPASPQTPVGSNAQENATSTNVSPWLAANRAAAAETLTGNASSVAGSAAAPVTPFTPGPGLLAGHGVISAGDLRTAMNAPLSISSTPQIQRPSATRVLPISSSYGSGSEAQMQEHFIGLLRARQQQQQQQSYHHMQQSSLHHS